MREIRTSGSTRGQWVASPVPLCPTLPAPLLSSPPGARTPAPVTELAQHAGYFIYYTDGSQSLSQSAPARYWPAATQREPTATAAAACPTLSGAGGGQRPRSE